jgi:hypothetical protein
MLTHCEHYSVGAQFHDRPLCGMFCTESEWRHPTYRKLFGSFLFFMQYIVPLIVIAVSYGVIAHHFNARSVLYKRVSSDLSSTPRLQRSFSRRKRTNRMLAAMIVTFAIALAPMALMNILNDFDAIPEFLQQQQYFVAAIGHLCAALSITIDPILYVIMNRKFHDVVLRTIVCQAHEKIRELSTSRYVLTVQFHSPSVRPKLVRTALEECRQKMIAIRCKNN